MERFFNTAGPVRPDLHYAVPPLARLDRAELLQLITQEKYFVLHAPRQTGKTTCLLALMRHLNEEGRYRCLYTNVEVGQAGRENVGAAMEAILSRLSADAKYYLGDSSLLERYRSVLDAQGPLAALEGLLSVWAETSPKPVVLLLDEIDSLVGDTLVSVLRQIRSGYARRPSGFPQSIVLCGVRDVRDYRLRTDEGKAVITGGSAFNIKAESLRLGSFAKGEVIALLAEHTQATGQPFTQEALALVWGLTLGQPWLVNALAYEACFRSKGGRDRSRPITTEQIAAAKESLILRQDTHLDNLADRLLEPRVRRVVEPILAGLSMAEVPPDDISYVVDLGLCRVSPDGGLVVANPIYREVLPRALAFVPSATLPQIKPTWLTAAGELDPAKLLEAFLAFWCQHGQPLLASASYHEIAPHLVLMAFLHRVVNGGGTLEREYAIGSGRMDLCLRYGKVVLGIELKVWRDGCVDPLVEGLEQLDGYLAGLGLDRGWLVVFDRRTGQPPIAERTSASSATSPAGRAVTVVRA